MSDVIEKRRQQQILRLRARPTRKNKRVEKLRGRFATASKFLRHE